VIVKVSVPVAVDDTVGDLIVTIPCAFVVAVAVPEARPELVTLTTVFAIGFSFLSPILIVA